MRAPGLTLLEMLITLLVLGVLALGALRVALPGAARRTADAYRSAAVAARLRALAGTTSSLRWEDDRGAFVLRWARDDGDPCDGAIRDLLTPQQGVAVTRRLRDGVAWLPDGTGRSCSGGGVYGGRIRFEDWHRAWDVVVSSSGRIRLEAVP